MLAAPGEKTTYRSRDGESTTILWEEDWLVCSKSVGTVDEALATGPLAWYRAVAERRGGPFCHLMDATEMDGVTGEARKILNDATMKKASSPYKKMAFFGVNFVMRTTVNLYSRVAEIPVRAFKTRDEAVAWLQAEE